MTVLTFIKAFYPHKVLTAERRLTPYILSADVFRIKFRTKAKISHAIGVTMKELMDNVKAYGEGNNR